ncbi:MAG: hypothetical protein ACR2H2_06590 [Solirubrobacteraceae bacterium]
MTGDTAAETAAHWKQWIIGADVRGRPVLPKHDFGGPKDRSYNLKNSKVRKFLQWERQTFGINLGWTDDAEPETGRKVARWFFARAGNSNEPIKYGESIAIGNGNDPSFIYYNHRDIGINLSYSNSPVFEWQLLGGPLKTPVKTGEWLAIFNERSEGGEPLLFFDRTRGGDIGWPSSRTWSDQAKGIAIRAAKDAAIAYLRSQTTGR